MSSSVIKDDQHIPAELRPLMGALAGCGVELARRIAKGEVDNGHSVELGSNSDGDQQKATAAARPRRPCALRGRGHQEALAPPGPDAVWVRRKTRGCSKR